MEAREEHEQFNRDIDYLNALRPRLWEEHPDCYVVVFKGKVVACGPVRKEVLADLDRLGVPRRLAAMKFISREPVRLQAGTWRGLPVRLDVSTRHSDADDGLPSLLGRDVLNRCNCNFDARERTVTVEPYGGL